MGGVMRGLSPSMPPASQAHKTAERMSHEILFWNARMGLATVRRRIQRRLVCWFFLTGQHQIRVIKKDTKRTNTRNTTKNNQAHRRAGTAECRADGAIYRCREN